MFPATACVQFRQYHAFAFLTFPDDASHSFGRCCQRHNGEVTILDNMVGHNVVMVDSGEGSDV